MNEYLRPMKENFGSGPRMGNDVREGKRDSFKAAKGERAGLADVVLAAFEARNFNEFNVSKYNPRLESVEGDVKPQMAKLATSGKSGVQARRK